MTVRWVQATWQTTGPGDGDDTDDARAGVWDAGFRLAYAGQTITLKFTGTQVSSTQTSFVIDDTAFNVS